MTLRYESQDQRMPSAQDYDQLNVLVAELQEAEAVLAELEQRVRVQKFLITQLSMHEIPILMAESAMGSEVTLPGGRNLKVTDVYSASIPAERKDEALRWLVESGNGALVKRSVVVSFPMKQETEAQQLLERLRGEFANTKEERKIESATLRAFVKRRIVDGHDLPRELFGVTELKKVKLTNPGDRK